jgi:S1-C subfamily serine protease
MMRSAAVSLAVLCLLLAGLAAGSGAVRAHEVEGEGEDRHAEGKFEKKVRVVRLAGEGGAFLGVGLDEVEGDARGAKVLSVEPESPAEEAGLQDEDVIVRFDGVQVRSARQLARLVGETPSGRVVPIEVERAGAKQKLTAKLGERRHRTHTLKHMVGPGLEDFDVTVDVPELPPHPDEPHVFRWHREDGSDPHDYTMLWEPFRPRLGIRFIEIEGQLADYFGLSAETGILVAAVSEATPADKSGMKAGDVILEFDSHTIRDGGDLRRAIREAEGAVAVKLQRDGRTRDIEVVLPERKKPPERMIHRRPTGVTL